MILGLLTGSESIWLDQRDGLGRIKGKLKDNFNSHLLLTLVLVHSYLGLLLYGLVEE